MWSDINEVPKSLQTYKGARLSLEQINRVAAEATQRGEAGNPNLAVIPYQLEMISGFPYVPVVETRGIRLTGVSSQKITVEANSHKICM